MWPREVFDIREGKKLLLEDVTRKLDKPGVYVLYRDDHPHYVGRTSTPLFDRIWEHANYDCEFVALAQDLGVPLVTSDQALIAKFKPAVVSMRTFSS